MGSGLSTSTSFTMLPMPLSISIAWLHVYENHDGPVTVGHPCLRRCDSRDRHWAAASGKKLTSFECNQSCLAGSSKKIIKRGLQFKLFGTKTSAKDTWEPEVIQPYALRSNGFYAKIFRPGSFRFEQQSSCWTLFYGALWLRADPISIFKKQSNQFFYRPVPRGFSNNMSNAVYVPGTGNWW